MGVDSAIDITDEQRKTILTLLQRYLPGTAAWTYGSRVKWTSRPQSDLDLVVFATPEQSGRVGVLREAFEESDLPFRVDLFVWDEVPASFRKQIGSEHVVLVEKEPFAYSDEISAWNARAWGDIATLEYGKALRNYRSTNGSYRVFGTNGPIGWHTERLYEGPSVIVGRKGAYRGIHYAPDPFFVIDTAFYLKPKDQFDARWAYYELLSHDINGLDSGSAIPSTSRESFYALPVLVPPLPEQRTIAHILGTLDDKIELTRRINETLEAMARALFKSWFVDFDPVRAKMESRDTGLPQDIVDLFPDRMVDSELGEIPEGWHPGHLADIAHAARRGVHPADVDFETPYIGLEHMPRHSIALMDWGSAGSVTSNKSVCRKGDILFGKLRPYFHKVGIAPLDGICSTDIVVIAPEAKEWTAFVLACVSSNDFVSYTNQTSTGTRMPRTNWENMGNYRICLPTTPVRRAFQNATRPMLDRIVANTHEFRTVTALRDTLLPKLISGELRVKDASERLGISR